MYVDALVLRDRDTDANGSLDERLYVQQDANWNVTSLTDASGAMKERYFDDPFGKVSIRDPFSWAERTSSLFAWEYLHQGGRLDGTSGLYHFRNRDYSPTLGRWTSVDPIGFSAGDNNVYRAEGNNPVNYVDPYGLQKITTLTGDTWPPRRPAPGPTPTQGGSLVPRPVRDFGGQVLNPQTYVNICSNTATCIGNLGNQLVGIGGQAITPQTYINICDNTMMCVGNLQATVGGQILIAGGMIGGSMVPGVGQGMDAAMVADPDEPWWNRFLAGGSLCVDTATGGILPNYAAVCGIPARIGRPLRRIADVIQDHHAIPFGNNTWKHQVHDLVQQAGNPKLKDLAENVRPLEGHIGRHTDAYNREIKRRMDKASDEVAGTGKDAALNKLKSVIEGIWDDIASGVLRPYDNQDVRFPRR